MEYGNIDPDVATHLRRIDETIAVQCDVIQQLLADVAALQGTDPEPPAPQPEPEPPAGLRWPAPDLVDPITVRVTDSSRKVRTEAGRDTIVDVTEPLTGTLTIEGAGRHVVLRGAHIAIPGPLDRTRAVYLRGDISGTIHIEGVLVEGEGVADGIVMALDKGATVQIQNCWFDHMKGSQATNHADLVQTWMGPRVLRVHNLTGTAGYQGIFMRPNDSNVGYRGQTDEVSLSNVQVIQTPASGYAFWKGVDYGIDYPVAVENCWVTNPRSSDRDQVLWPKGSDVWDGVSFGVPPGGDFVTRDAVGVGYA